jgi:hypothetical protein
MSVLHFSSIQSRGVAAIRRSSYLVSAFSGALHGLLATILLGVFEWRARQIIAGFQAFAHRQTINLSAQLRDHK